MGFQIGGAILDFLVLSILRQQDEYGYVLTQKVRAVLDVSETAMYPALKRLQKSQLLETYDMAYQGRNRRYYRLSDAGGETLKKYIVEWQIFKENLDAILKEEKI